MNHGTVTNLGRTAVIVYEGQCYTATVIDHVAGTLDPKRVRIFNDPFLQNKVLHPSQYLFKQWAPDED